VFSGSVSRTLEEETAMSTAQLGSYRHGRWWGE